MLSVTNNTIMLNENGECRYAECCYAERHYAECRYAECRGANSAAK